MLVECQQAIYYLWWDRPADTSVNADAETSITLVGDRARSLPTLGDVHWLINPLVTKHFRIYKVFARFLPGHQRSGQLAWSRSDTCIHITSNECGLSYELELEYQSKNHGEVHQERFTPSQFTVANPMVDSTALVVAGDHMGKLCTVKAINRDPKSKIIIGFKVKFEGAKRGQTPSFAYDAITRVDRRSADTRL